MCLKSTQRDVDNIGSVVGRESSTDVHEGKFATSFEGRNQSQNESVFSSTNQKSGMAGTMGDLFFLM